MARFIPDDIIDQIRIRTDIVDLIQNYVPTLKKAGTAWKACCPFHQEKTPSFTVNPERQSYKCFGCGKGGNIFSFVMEFEKLDFPNAVELLARKCGVIIPEPDPYYKNHSSNAEKPEANYSLRERLYILHEKIAEFYAKNLKEHPESAVGVYFKTREIPAEFTDKFMIGAAPDAWDAAINFARKENFTEDELRLSGIVSEKETDSKHIYDRFRNRLVFPIWNEQGRIVAFSARTVEANPQGWKYINSPESPIFKKSKTLYALHFARTSIAEKNAVVLCEGQLDTIALHRAGCTNAVAPQGTAFGQEQALILRRYSRNVTLAPDNDKAGRTAVFKDAAILLPMGFSLKTAVYSGAKDADEMLKTQGRDALKKAVESDAVDFFQFALNVYSEENDISVPAGKQKIVELMMEQLALIDSEAARDAYLEWLAKTISVDIQSLRNDMRTKMTNIQEKHRYQNIRREQQEKNVLSENPQNEKTAEQPRSIRMPGLRETMLDLFPVLLLDMNYAQKLPNDIKTEMLDESPLGLAIQSVIESVFNGEWESSAEKIMIKLQQHNLPLDEITDILEQTDRTHADLFPDRQTFEALPHEEKDLLRQKQEKQELLSDFTYKDCVQRIQCYFYKDKRQHLMRKAQSMPDTPEKMNIFREITECSKIIIELSKPILRTVHS